MSKTIPSDLSQQDLNMKNVKQETIEGCKFVYKTNKAHSLDLWRNFLAEKVKKQIKTNAKAKEVS